MTQDLTTSAVLGSSQHVAIDLYAGPIKRSMTIAGHPSSISLEPPFWAALEQSARETGLPLNALVARIDAERVDADGKANLASVLRCWLLDRALRG